MTTVRYLAEDELIRRAIEILVTNLGPVETARFLSLPQSRRMESVRRHRLWQKGLDKDLFFDQVFGL
jgi:hypothetical protein